MDILQYIYDMTRGFLEAWIGSFSPDKKVALALFTLYLAGGGFLYLFKRIIMYVHTTLMKKQNILLLKEEVSGIKVNRNHPERDFSFITDNLQETPIEKRNTFGIIGTAEFNSRLKRLKYYYESIKKEIKEHKIPEEVLSTKDIDYIINHVITEENIRLAIDKLNEKRKNNDAELAFIGNKMGLYEYNYDGKKIIWECYQSDHFTWKVFKELYLMDVTPAKEVYSPRGFFDNLCIRLSKYQSKKEYRQVLMHTLCYLFSSLGIDLLITGKDCRNRQVCLASVRSARIDRSHTSRIHVSVDESFSDTDQEQGGVYTVEKWARRGIEEEIGVPEDSQGKGTGKKSKITYTDFSIVLGYGEIGLSGIVEEKDMDTLLAYPGMDKALESDGMFLVQMPGVCSFLKILFRIRTGVQRYVASHTENPMSKLPWVEFAPPIYFRTILRKLTAPISLKDALLFISIISPLLPCFYNWLLTRHWSFDGFPTCFIIYVFIWILDHYSRKYTHFSLWVSLWNGNVKTLQTTGRSIIGSQERDVNKGLYLMTEGKPGISICMSQLRIMETPLCAVRRSLSREEIPISFYHVCRSTKDKNGSERFRLFSTYYQDYEIYYYVIRTQDKQQKSPSVLAYSFNFGMEKDDVLQFDKKIEELDIDRKSLQCYFGLHHLNMDNYAYCNKLPDPFCKEYQLHDLFEYKGDYYWSACHKQIFQKKNMHSLLSTLYYLHEKEEEKTERPRLNWEKQTMPSVRSEDEKIVSYHSVTPDEKKISIEILKLKADTKVQFEKKINRMIERSVERFGGKLNELEIVALQYILIRKGIFIADIKHGKLFRCLPTKWKRKADSLLDIGGLLK